MPQQKSLLGTASDVAKPVSTQATIKYPASSNRTITTYILATIIYMPAIAIYNPAMHTYTAAMAVYSLAIASYTAALTVYMPAIASYIRATTAYSSAMTIYTAAMTVYMLAMASYTAALTAYSPARASYIRANTTYTDATTSKYCVKAEYNRSKSKTINSNNSINNMKSNKNVAIRYNTFCYHFGVPVNKQMGKIRQKRTVF